LGGLNGLAPNVQDYALGLSVTFPLLELPAWHAREASQNAEIRSEEAKAAQIAVDLKAQWNRAVAMLNGARRIAGNKPLDVSAARTAVNQASARYQAGLANIDELAEAQRLLTQAEIDNVLARLGVSGNLEFHLRAHRNRGDILLRHGQSAANIHGDGGARGPFT
jgi:outer membrane protein TolC